jgi:hypothetical protein
MTLSGKSVNRIRLTRRFSSRLFAYCTFVLILTGLAIVSMSVSGKHAMLLLLPVIMLAYVSALRKHVYLSAGTAVMQLRRDSTNRWTIAYKNNEVACRLLGSSFVSAGLIVLRFSMPDRLLTESVVLLPDSIGKQVFHRLLVDLRTQAAIEDQAI